MRILLFFILFPSISYAQIVKCGDTWTNGGCSEETKVSLDEKPFEELKKEYRLKAEKQTLYHAYTSERYAAKREYGIKQNASYVQTVCLEQDSTIVECKQEIDKARSWLNERIKAAEEKRSDEKEEARKKRQAEQQNVVVINDADTFWLQQYQANINSQGVQAGVLPPNQRRINSLRRIRPQSFTAPSINRSGGFREPGVPGLNRR